MTEAELRAAAARGESTPVSAIGWMRLIARALALIALIIIFVPLHYLYRVLSYGSPFPMLFLRYAARVCGAKVEVIGTHLKRDVFFVANHISWVDIFVINALAPAAFVSKAEVRNWPVIGWLAARNDTIFLRRGSRGHARIINEETAALLDAAWASGCRSFTGRRSGPAAASLIPAPAADRPASWGRTAGWP